MEDAAKTLCTVPDDDDNTTQAFLDRVGPDLIKFGDGSHDHRLKRMWMECGGVKAQAVKEFRLITEEVEHT